MFFSFFLLLLLRIFVLLSSTFSGNNEGKLKPNHWRLNKYSLVEVLVSTIRTLLPRFFCDMFYRMFFNLNCYSSIHISDILVSLPCFSTFCVTDSCYFSVSGLERLEDTGKIDVLTTVEKIRSLITHSIQMSDQYVFCYLAIWEYALTRGLLQDVDWI